MLFLSKIPKGLFRSYCNIATKNIIEPLNYRSLLSIKGNEARDFLQGLITNDIDHLGKNTKGSMFTMFLNTKGRVLYDSIIYKIANDTFFIECDSEIEKSLQKHLMFYKIRRKIDISNLCNDYSLHVLFNSDNIQKENQKTEQKLFKEVLNSTSTPVEYKNLMIFKDPRVRELGYRIISNKDVDVKQEMNTFISTELFDSTNNYKLLRYSLGIGEGIIDLPVGNCFPLESNCDYLHGVSFHKGCYIGQELTARTYHTGVIRKRLMPLFFQKGPRTLPTSNTITSEKSNLGKLRGIEGNFGLALLRIDSALELAEFKVGNENAKVRKPHWWPITLPKEKIIQKT